VLEDIQDLVPVEAVSRKLLGELARPFAIATGGVQVTASIGISTLPDDAVDATALMKHADTAMYTAKQAGKNTLQFYRAAVANDPQARQASAANRD
jgi:diguanylate cyclase (GGDEF)-like protein